MSTPSNRVWIVQFRSKRNANWRIGYDLTVAGMQYSVFLKRKHADGAAKHYRSLYKPGNHHGYTFRVVEYAPKIKA